MTREEADLIGAMNMCDEISNEAYKKIMCRCEEQEPCEDAVSREQAVKTVVNWYLDLLEGKETKDIVNLLDALPSVRPTRKTGKWIPRNSFLLRYKCSECNCESEKYNFCPICGAEMEGGE